MAENGHSDGSLSGVNVFDEVHIKGERHHSLSYCGANDAKGDIRQRLQGTAVGEAVLVCVFCVVDDEAQRRFAATDRIDGYSTIGNELVSFIYIAKDFKASLRVQGEDSFRVRDAYILTQYEGRKQSSLCMNCALWHLGSVV